MCYKIRDPMARKPNFLLLLKLLEVLSFMGIYFDEEEPMKAWKIVLGLGAACVACCAIPLLGFTGGLTASAAALMACAGEFLPLAAALLAILLAWAGLWAWRRRSASRLASCPCTETCSKETCRA
ncbi:hypothetical protein [Chitinolyticbacter albus]|uniref:hypothetical protein n=1 Tax=Chitinolyticbacter albus TaxID=2961951 RepID=UPI00210E7110|nr:hypothetical protein [Chitinolyticbacter albus]